MIYKDRTGIRYGNLVALNPISRRSTSGEMIWNCKCDCGTYSEVLGGHLSSGHTVSCGCFAPIATSARTRKHGESRRITPEYRAWKHINNRCFNPNNKSYPNYGARGIKVCRRWRNSYEHFLEDMGRRPSPRLQIERVDNDGDYAPSNCIWGTRKEQANNKRNNVRISHAGVTKTIAQWADAIGVRDYIVRKRYKQCGWTMAEIINHYASSDIREIWKEVEAGHASSTNRVLGHSSRRQVA